MSNIYQTAAQVIEESFAADGALTPAELAMAHQIVRINERSTRMRRILAQVLQGLAVEDREAWLSQHTVPSDVISLLDETLAVEPIDSFVALPGYDEADLANRKTSAKRRIAAEAERQAARVVRGNTRQFATYAEKRAEAAAHLAGEGGATPHLDAEVGISGETKDDVANAIMASASAWTAVNAQVEAARISGQKAVEAAAGIESIDAAVVVAQEAMAQAVDTLPGD